jgi:hypothetical protein
MKLYYCMYVINNQDREIWLISTGYKKAYNLALKNLSELEGLESLMIKKA